jgi:hypothetical protein
MRGRLLVAAGLFLTVSGIALSAGAAYLYVYDHGHSDVIAKGVTVAGVDVGGLHARQAHALLDRQLGAQLRRPVELEAERRTFVVRPSAAGLRYDLTRMVGDAVTASRSGGLAHRLLRDLRGRSLRLAIPLRAGLSRPRVETFVDHVARVIDRPAKDARLIPKALALGVRVVPDRTGIAVKRPQLEQRLTRALLATSGTRAVAVPTRPVHARWTMRTLPHRYRTLILVSRETFTLRLYKNLKLVKTYGVAVGRAGLETPAGFYDINDKQVNPSWHVPLSSWAGDLAGRVIPPGPDDPIKARWLGFFDGAGIHGTSEDWSIGSAASHGCIRMHIWDVEELYDRVPLHTPIYVG